MIEVELPDGAIIEFPAGTPQTVMEGAIRAHLQQSAPSPTARQVEALRSGEPIAIPGFEAGKPPSAQDVLDLGVQGLATAGGMAAGAPLGPFGSAGGGALASSGGKYAARWIGQQLGLEGSEYPSAGESTLDAVAGAAGPTASAVARPIARAVTGVTKDMATRVKAGREAVQNTVKRRADEDAMAGRAFESAMRSNPMGEAVLGAHGKKLEDIPKWIAGQAQRTKATGTAMEREVVEKEVRELAKAMAKGGKIPTDKNAIISILTGVVLDSSQAAGLLFGAGLAASPIRVAAARRLLRSVRAVEWILEKAQGGITPSRLMAALSGLAAEKGIAPELKRDIRTLQTDGESEGLRGDRDHLERMMDGEPG